MSPTDPRPGTAEHARLRQIIDAQDAARRARWAALDARLDRHQAEIDRVLVAEREQARHEAVLAAEVAEEPAPAVVEGHVPAPAAEALLAASPWDPAFQAWRAEHVPSQSNSII